MQITRISLWTGKTRTQDLSITAAQYVQWEGGMVIQRAMPHLTPAEREFVISGMIPAEWEEMRAQTDEGTEDIGPDEEGD